MLRGKFLDLMLERCLNLRLLQSPLLVATLLLIRAIAGSHDACLVQTLRKTGDEEAEEYQDGVVQSLAPSTSESPSGSPPEFTEIGWMSVPNSGRSNNNNTGRINNSDNSNNIVTVASPFSNLSAIKHQRKLVELDTLGSSAMTASRRHGIHGSGNHGGGSRSTTVAGSVTNDNGNISRDSSGSHKEINMGWFRKQLAMLSFWQHHSGHFWWHFNGTNKLVRSQISAALLTTIGNATAPDRWWLFLAILSSIVLFVCLPLSFYFFPVDTGLCPNNSSNLSAALLLESRMPAGCMSPKQQEPRICPELCVPQDKECRLRLPRIFEANSKACIRNSQDAVVLSARLSSSTEPGDLRISLMSPDERRCFAFCKQLEPGVLGIHVAQASKPVAELRRDTCKGGFLLDTFCGSRLLLNCHMQTGTMEVTNDDRLMAVAVPDSNSGCGEVEICVGPGIDVSLMVLAVLGIELFLGEGKPERRSSMSSRTPSRLST